MTDQGRSLLDADAMIEAASRRRRLARAPVLDELAVLAQFDPARIDDLDAEVLEHFGQEVSGLAKGRAWALTPESRIERLAAMLRRGGAGEMGAVRQSTRPHYDTPQQKMLDSFTTQAVVPLEQRSERELMESLTVWRWANQAVVRAGLAGTVDTGPDRTYIEDRLEVLNVMRPVRKLAEQGCVGRDTEIGQLVEYLEAPAGTLSTEPPVVIHGVGGVGKSCLLARFMSDHVMTPLGSIAVDGGADLVDRHGWAYLDMDRPDLRTYDPVTVLDDVVRQVGAQFPLHSRAFDYLRGLSEEFGKGRGLESGGSTGEYTDLAIQFGKLLRGEVTDGLAIVVLDTWEELGRAPDYVRADLLRMFEFLSDVLHPFKLIVSGRALAVDFVDAARPDRELPVREFDLDGSIELLRFFLDDAPGEVVGHLDEIALDVYRIVGGNPMALKLAAGVIEQEGVAGLLDAADRASTIDTVRDEFVRGFLYQRILDHVVGEDEEPRVDSDPGALVTSSQLREAARATLVLREVDSRMIEDVILPGIGAPPEVDPDRVFDLLAGEVAFAEVAGDVLRIREEVRSPALRALRFERPGLVADIGGRAAEFHSGSGGSSTELAYHRLALGLPLDQVSALLGPATVRALERSLADLPESSADVLRATLESPGAIDDSADLRAWETRTYAAVESILSDPSPDTDAAWELLAERSERTAGTPLYGSESELRQVEGHTEAAVAAAALDYEAALAARDPVRFAAAGVRHALLLELLGRPAEAVSQLHSVRADGLLAGHLDLQLEVQLNVLTLLERAELLDTETQWALDLDARELLGAIGRRRAEQSSSLVRLLAAAFGREEPSRLRTAAREIGLGPDEDQALVVRLADTLRAWDERTDPPGRIASVAGIDATDDPASDWIASLAGLGSEAGRLLENVWRQERPPEEVREALRTIYLWWGVKRLRPGRGVGEDGAFLEEFPLKWSDPRLQEFSRLVSTAYPTTEHVLVIAQETGADVSQLNFQGPAALVWRSLIDELARQLKLADLVDVVLADDSTRSLHPRLRELVGRE